MGVADTLTLVGIRPPPSVWRRIPGSCHEEQSSKSVKRPSSETASVVCADGEGAAESCEGLALPARDLAERAAILAACESPTDALAHFDEMAWELVLDSHDEDMRS